MPPQKFYIFFNAIKIKRCISTVKIFDKKIKQIQRDRAMDVTNYKLYETLKEEIALRLVDRIKDIKRKFSCALDFGSMRGHLLPFLDKDMMDYIIQYDMSQQMLLKSEINSDLLTCKIIGEFENLCFRDNTFDMVVSNLNMHWINDIPISLSHIYKLLRPDGVFIATMFSHDTLYELRSSLQMAEIERCGGFSPRISPFVTLSDMGRLLHHSGFKLLTLDVDEIVINYPDLFELIFDLRGMAESKAFLLTSLGEKLLSHHYISKDIFISTAAIYQFMYPKDFASKGTQSQNISSRPGITATFQILNMIGWKEDPSQPKPAQRGSAKISFKDLDYVRKWETAP